jgi:hypothetical protein
VYDRRHCSSEFYLQNSQDSEQCIVWCTGHHLQRLSPWVGVCCQRLANVVVVQWRTRLSSAMMEKETSKLDHQATVVGRKSNDAPDYPVSPQTEKFSIFLVEKATTPMPLGLKKELLGALSWYSSIISAHYNSDTPRPRCSVI